LGKGFSGESNVLPPGEYLAGIIVAGAGIATGTGTGRPVLGSLTIPVYGTPTG